jgi:hypothetical protein
VGVTRAIAVLLALAGGGLIVTGVAMVHVPAALIIAGVLLLAGLFGIDME